MHGNPNSVSQPARVPCGVDDHRDKEGNLMASWDESANLPPQQEFLAAMRATFLDQVIARTRTRRTQVLCKRCNGPYLLATLRVDPEGPCGCERPCERSGCLAPSEGAAGDIMTIPDYPFG